LLCHHALFGQIVQHAPCGLAQARAPRQALLEPFAFDAVYGAFSGRGQIDANGKQVVGASVARYIARINET
jgi:hypothetical protein